MRVTEKRLFYLHFFRPQVTEEERYDSEGESAL